MSFYGSIFKFDGIPCSDYDLMMYTFDGTGDEDVEAASTVEIIDEFVGRKWKPYFYGTKFDKKLTFSITFGVNCDRLDKEQYLTRQEIANIYEWMTGYNSYKTLEIDQPDMIGYHYNAIVSEISTLSNGSYPYAFSATFTCDSPYAYLPREDFQYAVNGSTMIEFDNKSSHNGLYKPVIEINLIDGGSFSIKNTNDSNRGIEFENIPASIKKITVDNEHCVITNDKNVNEYDGFNFQWLGLKRGLNKLIIKGRGNFVIKCEFPVNIGA